MAENSDAYPHFWAILEQLPVALLYKESAKADIFANETACKLLGIIQPEKKPLKLSQLSEIRLLDQQHNKISLLSNPLLMALGGTEIRQPVLLDINGTSSPYMLQSQLIKLQFSLGNTIIVTLCPMQETIDNTAAAPSPDTHKVDKSGDKNAVQSTDIAELEEALAFDKLMSLISTELINVSSEALDQHVEDALAALGEFCHADRSYLFQFNDNLTEMSNTHEWVREGVTAHKENLQQIPDHALPYFFDKIQQDHIFAVADVSQLPPEASSEQQEFNNEDIRSVLCTAMLAGKQLIGFVGCDMVARQRNWTSNDLRRIKLVGEMIANSIQNVNYRVSLQQIQQQLLSANQELQKQANQDGLTGLANRRHFDEKLLEELQRSARSKLPLSLILLDIDLFKPYNDHYGHQAGDEALQQVAAALRKEARRQGEVAARYGGEEFALILPATDSEACLEVAERVQQHIKELKIRHSQSDIASYLTASIGCYSVIADKNTSAKHMLSKADQALYQAKAAGRNTIISAS
ncbi:diguanylate cyclase (GGDEF) domain-containing protein [Arsukibacterium tuosuense]|uniref:diguanylate cyclase n=1 Tax=Arsukibacterium tuosuense TaxID=1323745 RepID=A0A285IUZ0_9GAMM|nr:sensor domain-containing diguanylate cyclase [Arsukibacterium tuosuense]SNY51804.1 diguanylate cyclase (GGDEF) domain-containing protein [Arsukibacterium tuosuense]